MDSPMVNPYLPHPFPSVNEKGLPEKDVERRLAGALERDFLFEKGHVLGSMCSKPDEMAVRYHAMFSEANLGNRGLYPGTAGLEEELISDISELIHLDGGWGQFVGGGTEANITAMWIARNLSGKRKILAPESAHFSMKKAADLLSMELVDVALDDEYRMDVDALEKKMGDDVAAVMAIAGSTELGAVDPIKEISEVAGDVFLHVDAAFGGMVLPFLEELGMWEGEWDFRVEGVNSLSLDLHKMGMATVPSGMLLLREREYVNAISVESPYLTTKRNIGLAGTRPSGSVAGAYAVVKSLGKEGYRGIVRKCMENTHYLVDELGALGFEPILEPVMNVVAFRTDDAERIRSEMDRKGWKISTVRNPKGIRLVVMPYVTKQVIDEFTEALHGI